MGCIRMKQKKVWLLVGIPGSGKSTWVNKKLHELEAGSAVVISRDMIRFGILEQCGGDYFAYEDEVWDLFVRSIQSSIDHPFIEDIFVDATHISKGSRNKILNAINLNGAEKNCVVFKVPLEICLERNATRTGLALVPDKAIHNMYKSFSIPAKSEGFYHCIMVNEDGATIKEVINE